MPKLSQGNEFWTLEKCWEDIKVLHNDIISQKKENRWSIEVNRFTL